MGEELDAIEEFKEFINKSGWIFAKTYAKTAPHEYVVRNMYGNLYFDKMIKIIRHYGFNARYGNLKPTKYLIVGDYYYWTMGDPIRDTVIINRAKHADYALVNGYWTRRKKGSDENIHKSDSTGSDDSETQPTLL